MSWHLFRRDCWSGCCGIAGWNIGHGEVGAAIVFLVIAAALIFIDAFIIEAKNA